MIHDFPWTDMHELNLDWFLAEFKKLVEEWNQVQGEWDSLHDYVQNYFENLNVQTEIDNKINAMIADGSFATILTPLVEAALPTIVDGKLPAVVAAQISAVVASQISAVVAGQLPAVAAAAAAQEVGTWLAAHIDPDTGYVIDDTLTVLNAAADAKTVGDKFTDIDDLVDYFTEWVRSRNVWPETTRAGYYNLSGVYVSDANYLCSYFFPVEPDTEYYWSVPIDGNYSRVCFYTTDNASGFISYLGGVNAKQFTTPATCHYITISFGNSYGTTYNHDVCVNVSDDYNGTYSPYFAPYRMIKNDKVKKLSDITSYYDDNAKTVYGNNRFNPDDVVVGNLASGHIVSTNTTWRTTGFIYVKDLQSVYFSCENAGVRFSTALYFVSIYDADKVFIEQAVATSTPSPYTIPANAVWIRFSFQYNASYDKYMLEGNRVLFSPQFIDYSKKVIINKYSNYKWAVVGDSLTEGNSRTSMNYHDFIKQSLGLTVLNYGLSGTGYKRTEDESKAFYQRILNIDTTADVVTIFGSGNDMPYVASALGDVTDSTNDTICGCINLTIDNLYSIMPAVQLGIITPCPWKDYNPDNDNNAMAKYSAKLVEICRLRGIPCLDLYHCSNLRPWDADFRDLAYVYDNPDGVHPSELGHKIIASRFEEFIKSLLV